MAFPQSGVQYHRQSVLDSACAPVYNDRRSVAERGGAAVSARAERQGVGPSGGRVGKMQVHLRDGESLESLLNRFQKGVQSSGILSEFRARRHFISRAEKARMAARKAARRIARRRHSAERRRGI